MLLKDTCIKSLMPTWPCQMLHVQIPHVDAVYTKAEATKAKAEAATALAATAADGGAGEGTGSGDGEGIGDGEGTGSGDGNGAGSGDGTTTGSGDGATTGSGDAAAITSEMTSAAGTMAASAAGTMAASVAGPAAAPLAGFGSRTAPATKAYLFPSQLMVVSIGTLFIGPCTCKSVAGAVPAGTDVSGTLASLNVRKRILFPDTVSAIEAPLLVATPTWVVRTLAKSSGSARACSAVNPFLLKNALKAVSVGRTKMSFCPSGRATHAHAQSDTVHNGAPLQETHHRKDTY